MRARFGLQNEFRAWCGAAARAQNLRFDLSRAGTKVAAAEWDHLPGQGRSGEHKPDSHGRTSLPRRPAFRMAENNRPMLNLVGLPQ